MMRNENSVELSACVESVKSVSERAAYVKMTDATALLQGSGNSRSDYHGVIYRPHSSPSHATAPPSSPSPQEPPPLPPSRNAPHRVATNKNAADATRPFRARPTTAAVNTILYIRTKTRRFPGVLRPGPTTACSSQNTIWNRCPRLQKKGYNTTAEIHNI